MSVPAIVESQSLSVRSQNQSAISKAAQGFEAIFLREVIGSMRKAKLGGELLQSAATDGFREIADARTADEIAKQGAFGIAKLLEAQFSRQEDKQ
jgi:peptidoglycan hydrolase FlgJ